MTRRAHIWFLVAIILLTVGTVIALTRQQANFDEHRQIANEACSLALTNRKLLREMVQIEASEADHTDQAARVAKLQREVERIIATTKCQ